MSFMDSMFLCYLCFLFLIDRLYTVFPKSLDLNYIEWVQTSWKYSIYCTFAPLWTVLALFFCSETFDFDGTMSGRNSLVNMSVWVMSGSCLALWELRYKKHRGEENLNTVSFREKTV